MLVKIGVSNRHIHLTKETYNKLFKDEYLTVKRYLNQPGEYASTKVVDVLIGNRIIKDVRIVGPFRNYNQVELLESDFLKNEELPPRKQSGDLDNSLPVTLRNGGLLVSLDKGLILATKHIHMDKLMCDNLGLKHNEEVSIYKDNKYLFNALIKESDKSYFELHIDKDDEDNYNLLEGTEVEIRLCGK